MLRRSPPRASEALPYERLALVACPLLFACGSEDAGPGAGASGPPGSSGAPAATPGATPAGMPTELVETLPSGARLAEDSKLQMVHVPLPEADSTCLQGTFEVYEDRAAQEGRTISLHVVVLPATGPDRKPDPIVQLAGGPGLAATSMLWSFAVSPLRRDRDIVLVDQRGTGASNPLQCVSAETIQDQQAFLEPIFEAERFRNCMTELQARADLRLYSTPIAMDDLDALLDELGYDQVNLFGSSYGTRAALVYMQRHPERVRSAILLGVAPTSLRNPLYHAAAAQDALDAVFDACAADPACSSTFPELRAEFDEVLARLTKAPVDLTIMDERGSTADLSLTYNSFAEALRVLLYSSSGASQIPLLLHGAFEGDFETFARIGVATGASVRSSLSFGLLLSVTCAEDVARILPEEIEAATAGTFLGDYRVRTQKELCAFWPKSVLPEDYAAPVACDAAALLVSGSMDPVTPPRFAAEAAEHLPNGAHIVVPRGHDLASPCVDSMIVHVLETGSTAGLDTSCVEQMDTLTFQVAR